MTFRAVITGAVIPVVTVSGDADLTAAGQLGEALAAAQERYPAAASIIVEASQMTFADAAATRALLAAAQAARRRGGTLTLLGAQPVVRRVISILDEDHLITLPTSGPDLYYAGARPA